MTFPRSSSTTREHSFAIGKLVFFASQSYGILASLPSEGERKWNHRRKLLIEFPSQGGFCALLLELEKGGARLVQYLKLAKAILLKSER